MDPATIYSFSVTHGAATGICLVLFIALLWALRVILDEDKSSLWRSRFYKAILQISRKKCHEKKYLSNEIMARLNLARRDIHYGSESLPRISSIEWVDGELNQTYNISDGEYIVRLDPSEDQHKNVVRMTEAVVRHTALTGIRHLVHGPISDSIDLTMIKKILSLSGNRRSIDYFFQEIYPTEGKDPSFDEWNKQVVRIDEYGLFERLMIVELEDFARRVHGMAPRPYMIGNVEYFVKWLHKIATKQEGEEVPLEYFRTHISVGLVLVAKTATIRQSGIDRYLEAVEIYIQSGADTVYVIIWDRPNLSDWWSYKRVCESLVDAIPKKTVLQHHFTHEYEYVDVEGKKRTGAISRFLKTA